MRDESVYNQNFLDEITQDLPKHSWTVQKDAASSVATLRNLLWPGYYAYHRINTPQYGSVYIGYGIRNGDLPFML
jgi:radial spoke head protein 9